MDILVSQSSSTQGFCNGTNEISEYGFTVADSGIAGISLDSYKLIYKKCGNVLYILGNSCCQ